MSTPRHLLFIDGVCVLCNHLVHFIHARDRRDSLLFASLQGAIARDALAREGKDSAALDGVYVLVDRGGPDEKLLWKYEAVRFVLKQLGSGWKALGLLMGVLPAPVGNVFYDWVARNRYRWFGKYDQCPLPAPALRRKFIEDAG